MPTITHTILGPDGAPLAYALVTFRRMDPARLTASGSLPGVNAAVQCSTDADGELSVGLGAGFWMVNWCVGAAVSRHIIDVPEGSSTLAMEDLMAGTEVPGRVVQIRWGNSEEETLDGAGILSLEGVVARASIAGDYEFGSGGYKFVAWPDAARPPIPATGIWDPATDLPAILAGADEGFTETDGGWTYRLVNVSGAAWRLFRTRQAVGSAITLRIA